MVAELSKLEQAILGSVVLLTKVSHPYISLAKTVKVDLQGCIEDMYEFIPSWKRVG